MRKTLLLSSIAIIVGFTSCKKLDACFDVSNASPDLGEEVSFTDCSEKAEYHEYDFGTEINDTYLFWYSESEPATSDDANATFTYDAPGTYTVTLTVQDKKKKKSEETTATIIIDAPTASDIKGNWNKVKETTTTSFLFGASSFVVVDEDWVFDTDSVQGDVDGIEETNYEIIMGSDGTFTLKNNLTNDSYNIIKLHDGEMILREESDLGYVDHLFEK